MDSTSLAATARSPSSASSPASAAAAHALQASFSPEAFVAFIRSSLLRLDALASPSEWSQYEVELVICSLTCAFQADEESGGTSTTRGSLLSGFDKSLLEPVMAAAEPLPFESQVFAQAAAFARDSSYLNALLSRVETSLAAPGASERAHGATLHLLASVLTHASSSANLPPAALAILQAAVDRLFSRAIDLFSTSRAAPVIASSTLPALFAFDARYPSTTDPTSSRWGRRKRWTAALWSTTADSQTSIDAALSIVCPLFDVFFGLDVNRAAPAAAAAASKKPAAAASTMTTRFMGADAMGLDLRREPRFWDVIQAGLSDNDPTRDKLCVFLLKRVVDFSAKFGAAVALDGGRGALSDGRFKWDSKSVKRQTQIWNELIVMLETIREPGPHLVEPLLPRLAQLLNGWSDTVDSSWWVVVLDRGILHEVIPVRKTILEYALTVKSESHAAALAKHVGFVCERLFQQVDLSALYLMQGNGLFVSPFGELVRGFVKVMLENLSNLDERNEFLRTVMVKATKFVNRIAALYVFMGLHDVAVAQRQELQQKRERLYPFRTEEYRILRVLMTSERASTVWSKPDSRRLLRHLVIGMLVEFTQFATVSVEDAMLTLHAFAGMEPADVSSTEYLYVQKWMHLGFTAASATTESRSEPGAIVATEAGLLVKQFLEMQGASRDTEIIRSKQLALFLHYFLPASDAPSTSQFASLCLEALTNRLSRLSSGGMLYAPAGTVPRTLILLSALLPFLPKPRLEQTLPASRDFAADVAEAAINVLYDPSADVGTRDEAAALLRAMAVPATAAAAPHSSLLADWCGYYRVSDWFAEWMSTALRVLQSNGGSGEMNSLLANQLAKKSALDVVEIVLSSYNSVQPRGGISLTADAVEFFLTGVKLEKILSSNEDRFFSWNDLQNRFQFSQYRASAALIRVTAQIDSATLTARAAPLLQTLTSLLQTSTSATAIDLFALLSTALAAHPTARDPLPDADVAAAVAAGLGVVRENWTNAKHFAALVRGFVGVAFHDRVLEGSVGEETNLAAEEAASTLLAWGAQKLSIVPVMSARCSSFWKTAVSTAAAANTSTRRAALSSMHRFVDVVVDLLLFGPYREKDRDEHKLDATTAYNLRVAKSDGGEECVGEDLVGTAEINFHCIDYVVRVQVNDILTRLDPYDADHNALALKILDRLLALHNSEKISAKFAMAADHRQQIRLWCSIHLLVSHIRSDGLSWLEKFVKAVDHELVISIRYYAEWAVIRLAIAFPDSCSLIWSRLADYASRAHTVSSLISIVSHVGPNIPTTHQPAFFRTAFSSLRPWMTSNHFTIRLFAQYVYHKFYALCRGGGGELRDAVGEDGGLAAFLEANPECARHRKKAEKLYFVGGRFDPVADVTVGFIFRGGLIVGGVGETEIISSRAFERVDPSPGRTLPLHHDPAKRAFWVPDDIDLESIGEDAPPAVSAATVAEQRVVPLTTSAEEEVPLQRKIVPWEAFMLTELDFSVGRDAMREKPRNPLIIVATFVSRIPNLGGLCRTAEIFNAECLVVSSLKVKSDPEFLATAVTADRWMPMAEVGEHDLRNYLESKKADGYCLVGIEQATRSVSLETFKFPRKCVVLLGKEREGVPADFLPLLDHILEIPQLGLIRSLNVHVSGALTIWEYTRQTLLDS